MPPRCARSLTASPYTSAAAAPEVACATCALLDCYMRSRGCMAICTHYAYLRCCCSHGNRSCASLSTCCRASPLVDAVAGAGHACRAISASNTLASSTKLMLCMDDDCLWQASRSARGADMSGPVNRSNESRSDQKTELRVCGTTTRSARLQVRGSLQDESASNCRCRRSCSQEKQHTCLATGNPANQVRTSSGRAADHLVHSVDATPGQSMHSTLLHGRLPDRLPSQQIYRPASPLKASRQSRRTASTTRQAPLPASAP